LKCLPAAERQETLDEDFRPLSRLHCPSRNALRALVVGQLARQEIEAAHDRGQKIVEIVGDAAGQLAERFDFLRLMEPGKRVFAVAGRRFDALFEGQVYLA